MATEEANIEKPKTPLAVIWHKNAQTNEWFDLLRLDLNASYFQPNKKGVYVIWYVDPNIARVIKVGSGILLNQLVSARANPFILAYSRAGTLKVSWITVNGVMNEQQMAGVEAFLQKTYSPIISDRVHTVEPVAVKLMGQ